MYSKSLLNNIGSITKCCTERVSMYFLKLQCASIAGRSTHAQVEKVNYKWKSICLELCNFSSAIING